MKWFRNNLRLKLGQRQHFYLKTGTCVYFGRYWPGQRRLLELDGAVEFKLFEKGWHLMVFILIKTAICRFIRTFFRLIRSTYCLFNYCWILTLVPSALGCLFCSFSLSYHRVYVSGSLAWSDDWGRIIVQFKLETGPFWICYLRSLKTWDRNFINGSLKISR